VASLFKIYPALKFAKIRKKVETANVHKNALSPSVESPSCRQAPPESTRPRRLWTIFFSAQENRIPSGQYLASPLSFSVSHPKLVRTASAQLRQSTGQSCQV